jgi:hypothetical protein
MHKMAMMSNLFYICLALIFVTKPPQVVAQRPGWFQGVTTRYWDCCKPSCGWWGKAPFTQPVLSCNAKGSPVSYHTPSGCEAGGWAFACSNQGPFIVSKNMSYGFAAAKLKGMTERDWCCKCYKLTFQNTKVAGKEMIVQVTNTGWDLSNNHFDIAIPGGGQGVFKGCTKQYRNYSGGNDYGGVLSAQECWRLPKHLIQGCLWRFTWFMNADNPKLLFKEVPCPPVLTNITQCQRTRP